LYADAWLRRPSDGRFLEYLTPDDSLDLRTIAWLAYELRQPCPVAQLPNVVAWVGHQAAKNALLTKQRSADQCEIASWTARKIATPLKCQIVHTLIWRACRGRRPATGIGMNMLVVVTTQARERAMAIIDIARYMQIARYLDGAIILEL
jgi:hypothetical protein